MKTNAKFINQNQNRGQVMKVRAHIHSLKDHKNNRHVLGGAEIIRCISDSLYLAEVNCVPCSAIFDPFVNRCFADEIYGIQQ